MINLKKLTFLLSAAAFMHYHIQGMGQKDLSRLTQTSPAPSAWQRFGKSLYRQSQDLYSYTYLF